MTSDQLKTIGGIALLTLIAGALIWTQDYWILAIVVIAMGLVAFTQGESSFGKIVAVAGTLVVLAAVVTANGYLQKWEAAALENVQLKGKLDTMAAHHYPELEKLRGELKRLQVELQEARKSVAPAVTQEPTVPAITSTNPCPTTNAPSPWVSYEERARRHEELKKQGKLLNVDP